MYPDRSSHQTLACTVQVQLTFVLFPTMYFIGKYTLVQDRDTFRLELDYRSIMRILVKVLCHENGAGTSEGAYSVA